MSSTSVPSRLAACTASWATAAASAPRSRATTGVPVLSPHCWSCSMAAALNVSPAANILVPGKKRESLPMVVVLPVPFTPTIRITVGVCETSSSTGPSKMRAACSIMSFRNSSPPLIFFCNASCSSSATSFAVVGTPTSEEIRISSTLSQNSSSSTSLNSATAALSCPTNEARLRLRPCFSLPNHPPDSWRSAIVSDASSTAPGSSRSSSDSSTSHTSSGAGTFLSACTSSAVGTSSAASSTDVWRSAARWPLPSSTSSVERSCLLATAWPFSCSSSVSRLKKLRHERAIGDFLLSLQTLRHNSGGPGGILNYPVEHIRRGHRSFLMGDQQILAVSPVRVYHREETGQVEIVERRLGLVEDAESPRIPTRPAQEHAEQERQREQGPFAPGQYTQGPPALPPQPQPNLHPVLREIQDPGRSLEHPRHHLPERIPYPPEGLRETRLYLSVHGLYYAVEFVGCGLCVGPLGRDELVTFTQSLFLGEGEEVYVPKALEPAGEGDTCSVSTLPVLLCLVAGSIKGGAPLRLYLLACLGRRGFCPAHLF